MEQHKEGAGKVKDRIPRFRLLKGCASLPLFLLQFKRKSTEGVSYFLFALVIVGNTMYGLSVLLKNPDWDQGEKSYMVHHLPWLVGSLGTLTLDLIVSFSKNNTTTTTNQTHQRSAAAATGPPRCLQSHIHATF